MKEGSHELYVLRQKEQKMEQNFRQWEYEREVARNLGHEFILPIAESKYKYLGIRVEE